MPKLKSGRRKNRRIKDQETGIWERGVDEGTNFNPRRGGFRQMAGDVWQDIIIGVAV